MTLTPNEIIHVYRMRVAAFESLGFDYITARIKACKKEV